MRIKRAGLITCLVILILTVYAAVTLIGLRVRIEDAKAKTVEIAAQVEERERANEILRYEIAHSGDPETYETVARTKLGLISPGEEIFYDYKEGEGTEGLTVTYHLLDEKERTCEVAGRYNDDDVTTLAVAENTTGAVSIPKDAVGNAVIRIGAYSFYELEGITEVRLPNSVSQIGREAFARCYNLKDVYMPVSQPLQFTDAYGDEMDESMGHNDAFYRVGEGDDGEGFATLHVPAGSRSAWNVYPWNEWFRMIADDISVAKRGDVNGDGEVKVGDLVSISNFMAGDEIVYKDAADVNQDGEVNVGDMVVISNIMSGNE